MWNMRRKKYRHLKRSIRRLFPSRSIIVISEEAVDHYPLSGMLQVGLLGAIVAFFSWISFSTGSYMAAQAVLQEKELKIVTTSMENKRIGEEYSLLKKDLLKLRESKNELSEYDEFVLEQYANDDTSKPGMDYFSIDSVKLQYRDEGDNRKNSAEQRKDKLFERISFLEQRIKKLKEENSNFIAAVRATTNSKISELEDLIQMTGLKLHTIKKIAKVELRKEEKEAMRHGKSEGFDSQGGPYIPEKIDYWQEHEGELFNKLDELVVLQRIAETLPLAAPLPNARNTSGFGRRIDPFTKRWALHSGMDYVGSYHAKVYATNSGTVTTAGRKGAYGNMVEVDHGLGISTRYGHLYKVLVKRGQKIYKGQVIGLQGSTGRSTGQHVHYEVRYKNRPLNPKNFIKAGKYVLKK